MEIKVVNAGNCMICGKPIIVPERNNNELPDIFFCKGCLTHIIGEDIKIERREKNENKINN